MEKDDSAIAQRLPKEKQIFGGLGPDFQKLLDNTGFIDQLLVLLKKHRYGRRIKLIGLSQISSKQ